MKPLSPQEYLTILATSGSDILGQDAVKSEIPTNGVHFPITLELKSGVLQNARNYSISSMFIRGHPRKQVAKELILGIKNFFMCMGHPIALGLTAKAPRILMYHRFSRQPDSRRISQDIFEQQLKYLKANFNVIRLTDLARILREGHTPKRNTAVITIDDGYLDCLQIAVPLLVKYGIPATVFIVSDFADQKIWLWYDAIHYLTTHAPAGNSKIEFNRKAFNFRLNSADDRNRMWALLADMVLPETNACKWNLINECQMQLGVALPPIPTEAYRAMNWDELTSLGPLIDIGSHTRSHTILTTLQDPDELAREIQGSKMHIEKNIGKPVTAFAYPNGQASDYNDLAIREVKRSGYECALVAYGGLTTPSKNNLFELPRVSAQNTLGIFKNTTSGLSFLKKRFTGR